jgi:O-antigen/teichoic acid export membrane protein
MHFRTLVAKTNYTIAKDVVAAIRSKDDHVLQPIVLFGSMVLSMGITFISSIITARLLGPSNYGDLKYIQTVWSMLALVISFGYFYSGSRALVLEKNIQKCREISGTLILLSLIMGVIISFVLVVIAYPLDIIFHTHLATITIYLAPLVLILPLSQALPLILQSTNQIYWLAVLTSAPSILYTITILALSWTKHISISSVLIAQQLTIFFVIVLILIYIKPSLASMQFWWNEIKKHHKTYGVPVYRGALAGVGSTYLIRLAISFWVDNIAIGFYSLASSLVIPLSLIPNAIATSNFRSFADKQRISNKTLLATIFLCLATLVFAFIFFGSPLSWIYTSKFQEVGPMARALAIGSILLGFGDLFNRFLGAHGKGKSIQNAAYANGIVTVICILIFVPLWGAWGAILATVLPNGIYFSLLFLSYRAFTHQNAS